MYLLKRSLLSFAPPTRLFTCRSTRQFSGTAPILKFRRSPRFCSSRLQDDGGVLPDQIIQRVSYFISENVPRVALGFFNKKMSQLDAEDPMRPIIFDTVLDLFLRKRHFDEADKVVTRMDIEGLISSPPSYMKILSLQLANDVITEVDFLSSLRKVFKGQLKDIRQFHDFLHDVERSEYPVDLTEKIINVYIESQGPGFWLDSLSVTHIIMRFLSSGSQADAERWLDYHSQRLQEGKGESDTNSAVPYTAFIHSLFDCGLVPVDEPVVTYKPVLDRMAHDGAWPDSMLVNTLITVELRFGRPESVLRLYDIIRENRNNMVAIFPEESTFTQLFSAAGRVVQYASIRNEEPKLPLQPRVLFREMIELQKLIDAGVVNIPESPDVLTENSLGAAMWQFIESGDYAGACVALRFYAHMSIPFEWRAVQNTVTNALFARCKRDIIRREGGDGLTWVDMFLDLRDVNKEQLRNEPAHRSLRRILDITKRDVLSGVTPESEAPVSTPLFPEGQKLPKIRVRRLQLLDKLLTRALTAALATEGESASSCPAVMIVYRNQEAIRKAEEDMIPTPEQIESSIYAPRLPDNDVEAATMPVPETTPNFGTLRNSGSMPNSETTSNSETASNPERHSISEEDVEEMPQGYPYMPPDPLPEEYDFAFFGPRRSTTHGPGTDPLLLNGYY